MQMCVLKNYLNVSQRNFRLCDLKDIFLFCLGIGLDIFKCAILSWQKAYLLISPQTSLLSFCLFAHNPKVLSFFSLQFCIKKNASSSCAIFSLLRKLIQNRWLVGGQFAYNNVAFFFMPYSVMDYLWVFYFVEF